MGAASRFWIYLFGLGLVLCLSLVSVSAMALPAEEEKRLEVLLERLAGQTEVVFIRNDKEYTAAQAVTHLKLKLGHAKGKVDTAEEFIDKAGSASSISGKPYLIRQPGQEAEPAGPFLHKLLPAKPAGQ